MKLLIKIIAIMFLLGVVTTISAQKEDYSDYAGFLDLKDFGKFKSGEESTEILIEKHLLKMVAKLSHKEDPELESVLSGLKLIKVNIFEIKKDELTNIFSKIKDYDNQLINRDWDRIIKTKNNDEFINIYIKTQDENKIQGLVVMFANEKDSQAGFVNIVGDIDLETIGRLSDKFDIPELDKIGSKKNEK